MKRTSKLVAAVLAGVTGLGLAGAAIAADKASEADNEKAEVAAALNAKIGFTEAIKVAETKTGGKVLEAGIEVEDGKTAYYEVEVVKADGSEHEVHVDATTGRVVKAISGENEHEDEEMTEHN